MGILAGLAPRRTLGAGGGGKGRGYGQGSGRGSGMDILGGSHQRAHQCSGQGRVRYIS